MNTKESRLAKLRERAEIVLKDGNPLLDDELNTDIAIEELRIHQVELELQLEDLNQTYAALESAQQRYSKLFDNAPIGYFVIGTDGLITNVNLAASEMLEYERNELTGRILAEFVSPDFQDIYYFWWRALQHQKLAQSCELELQRKNGTRIPVLLNSHLPEPESNEILLVVTDVSRIKQSDAALARSSELSKEINHARLNILSAISPEFRRPLSTILSSVDLLYKHGRRLTEKKRAQLYQSIRNLLWYLNDTIQDAHNIQEIERNQLLRMEAFDVIAFTQQVVSDMEAVTNGRKIVLEIVSQQEKANIIWDMNLYRRILMNLFGGLLKFSNRSIRCYLDVKETKFTLRLDTQATNLSEEELALMFESFSEGRNTEFIQGRGNGLLLAYHTIQTHGGNIRYKSYEGRGISFIIELPKLQSNPSPYRH